MRDDSAVQVENGDGSQLSEKDPSLAKLAITSFNVPVDDSLANFAANYKGCPNLSDDKTCQELIKALNEWGCRLPTTDHLNAVVGALQDWFHDHGELLPEPVTVITDLSREARQKANKAYVELRKRIIVFRRFGPTAAAKTLFALRPQSLMPWDGEIRAALKYDGYGPDHYMKFLRHVQAVLVALGKECEDREKGLGLRNLRGRLHRSNVPLTRLVDLYYYSTITRREPLPTRADVQLWCDWGLS